jgi:hypothetical protein
MAIADILQQRMQRIWMNIHPQQFYQNTETFKTSSFTIICGCTQILSLSVLFYMAACKRSFSMQQ